MASSQPLLPRAEWERRYVLRMVVAHHYPDTQVAQELASVGWLAEGIRGLSPEAAADQEMSGRGDGDAGTPDASADDHRPSP